MSTERTTPASFMNRALNEESMASLSSLLWDLYCKTNSQKDFRENGSSLCQLHGGKCNSGKVHVETMLASILSHDQGMAERLW